MLKTIGNSWALFLGMGFIMLGNGLQGSLLGLRASIEGFSITATGIVMSGFYIGIIAGSIIVPKIVGQVGHVRTFGALASLASTAILIHLVFLQPAVWLAMRIVSGFAFAGIYIVAESWLNDVAENETRGQLLSIYMLIYLGALAGGQFLLNVAPPESVTLFILVSALVSIALIPILISANKAPAYSATESAGIRQLYNISPLGVFGIFAAGISSGAVFAIGSVYGGKCQSFYQRNFDLHGVLDYRWINSAISHRLFVGYDRAKKTHYFYQLGRDVCISDNVSHTGRRYVVLHDDRPCRRPQLTALFLMHGSHQ